MPSREELESHPVTTLKKEISKTNIKGYSKMKKPEIVELMLKNKSRFHHIKMAEKKPKKGTHKMPDGTVMSGTVHNKDSKPVEKPKAKPKPKAKAEKPKEKPKEKSKPKPKAQISEVDFMEKSILDDIEKEVKKSKYKDRLDMNTLIDAGENMEKSQRLRAFEIIKKILKTINTKEVNSLYPLEVIKKRLKL